jgi:hypothetical protein
MSEARKYHLNLIVANQFTTQLTEEIRDAVFGNMGTIVSFRVGQSDVDSLSRYFQPLFEAEDLLRVPNYNTITRTLVHGVPTQSFSMATLPPLGKPNPQLADALKQLSAAKFGRTKAVVEKEIFARLATQPAPRPSYGSPAAPGGGFNANPYASSPFGQNAPGGLPVAQRPMSGQASPAPKPPGTGSFLDEWLAKRQAPGQVPATNQPGRPAAGQPLSPSAAGQPFSNPYGQPFGQPASNTPAAPQPSFQPSTPPVSATTPQPASQNEATIPAPPPANANISSAQLQKEEVATVAEEIRHALEDPMPADKQAPPSSEGNLQQQAQPTPDQSNDGTIIIKRDED